MKEIVIISGKGGTGKTYITASFAFLEKENAVVADCDVDAANMYLLLKPETIESNDFFSGVKAFIHQKNCIKCRICENVCRFGAIIYRNSNFYINKLNCEGCGYCSKVCPTQVIEMIEQNVGKQFISKTRFNNILVHARLGIGAENSGKLVAKVKQEAKRIAENKDVEYILVDGAPGIGCPVLSSLTGADFVVLVTEATISGFHDLKRVIELIKNFNLKAACIINKYDLNINKTNEIIEYLNSVGIEMLTKIPYNIAFTHALTQGKTITEFDNNQISELIKDSWEKIKRNLK